MIKMHGVKWIFRSFNGFSLRYGSVQCQFCRQSFLIVCYNVANCLRTYTIIKNIREEKKINKQVHIYFKKRTKSCSFRFNLRYYIYIYIYDAFGACLFRCCCFILIMCWAFVRMSVRLVERNTLNGNVSHGTIVCNNSDSPNILL